MISKLKAIDSSISIVIITGYSDVKMAVKVMKRGAFEYVTKPIIPEEILHTLEQALKRKNEQTESQESTKTSNSKKRKSAKKSTNEPAGYVVGKGVKSQQIQNLISLVAPTDMTVVITGESGTGKEVTAKAIHAQSNRKNAPMVAVDCGALPKDLAGSMLFGHLKGAFTGALTNKIGHFEAAQGGTLFLDEIGNLSYENQIKLLRVLQERKIQRIGDTKDIDIDVRIIAATNENLKAAVEEGAFREDLFYRLNEFNIELLNLSQRTDDLEELSSYLLSLAADELNKEMKGFDGKVMTAFKKYNWPGNIRELKNVIKRATLMSASNKITLDAIPPEIQTPELYAINDHEGEESLDLKSVTERAEKKAILKVLKLTGFNKSKSAKMLKVDRKTLYNKIKMFDIELP
jgi:two-component system response regulator HydG